MLNNPLSAETFKAIACPVVPTKTPDFSTLGTAIFGRWLGEAPLVLRNSEKCCEVNLA